MEKKTEKRKSKNLTRFKGVYREGDSFRGVITYRGERISLRGKTAKECYFKLQVRKKEIDESLDPNLKKERTEKICSSQEVEKNEIEINEENEKTETVESETSTDTLIVPLLTIKDLFLEFMETKIDIFNEKTIRLYYSLFNNHFKSIQNVNLSEINDEFLIDWIKKVNKINDKKDLRNQSEVPKRCVLVMKKMLTFAIRKRYIFTPLDFSFENRVKKNIGVTEKTEENYLTYGELLLITKACEEHKDVINELLDAEMSLFIIRFLYFTGLRIGEAQAVYVRDIKKEHNRLSNNNIYYVDVNKQFNEHKRIIENRLKGDAMSRKVLILKEQYEEFMSFFEKRGYSENRLVFDFRNWGDPSARQRISEKIKELILALKTNGFIPSHINHNISPHGLRHSNTIYHKNVLKLDVIEAAKIEGHKPSVLVDVYDRIDKMSLFKKFGSDDK